MTEPRRRSKATGEHPAQRADARRNRQRILRAADRAFAAEGTSVPLDRIAEVAGVGPGTVHRNFPRKDELLAAVLAVRLSDLAALAVERRKAADPGEAFFEFLGVLVERSRNNLALVTALAGPAEVSDLVREAAGTLESALAELLARAQSAGAVRADLDARELHALVAGILTAEQRLPESARGRGVALVADGLRANLASSKPDKKGPV